MSSQQDGNNERWGTRVGRLLAIVLIVFAVSFAAIAATRLNEKSLTIILGVGVGVLAVGIPTGALILITGFISRIYEARSAHNPQAAAPTPPVIVVQSPTPPTQGGYPQLGYDNTSWYPRAPRQFEVIGDEATDRQEGRWERR